MSGTEVERIEELARLLEGHPTPADDAGELRALASLATALREAPVEAPRPEFRDALRATLVREASELLPVRPAAPSPVSLRERWARLRRSASLALASALSATAIGGAGVVAAAERAQPDDVLYGTKRVTERVRLALAGDESERGHLELAFASRRLDEVAAGAHDLPTDVLVDLLRAMDRHSQNGAVSLLEAYDRSGDGTLLRDVADFVTRQRSTLHDVLPELPVEVQPFAQDSLELVRRIEVEVAGVALTGCAPCADAPATISRPGEGPLGRSCCSRPAGGALVPEGSEPGTSGSGDTGTTSSGSGAPATASTSGPTSGSSSEPGLTDGLVTSEPLSTTLPTLEPTLPPLEPSPSPTLEPSLPEPTELLDTADDLLFGE